MAGESLLSQKWFVIVHVTLLHRQERGATCTILKWSQCRLPCVSSCVHCLSTWRFKWNLNNSYPLFAGLLLRNCESDTILSVNLNFIFLHLQWIIPQCRCLHLSWPELITLEWSKVRNRHCEKATSLSLWKICNLKEVEKISSCSWWLLFELTKVNPPLPKSDPQMV